MKTREVLVATGALWLVWGPVCAAPPAGPVAILTDAVKVQVKRAGSKKFEPLTTDYARLSKGDVVRVLDKGKGALWQVRRAYSQLWLTAPRDEGPLETEGTAEKDYITRPIYERIESRYLPASMQAQLPSPGIAGVPGEQPTFAVTPRQDRVLTGRPEFCWNAQLAADAYQIEVYDGLDNELWSTTVPPSSGGILPYPPARAALPPGAYKWRIIAQKDGKPLLRAGEEGERTVGDTQPFTVATPEQAAQAAQAETAIRALSAQTVPPADRARVCALIYLDQEMYRKAEALLVDTCQSFPKDVSLRKLLLHLYWKTGRYTDREHLRRATTDAARSAVLKELSRALPQ